jgi:hypothetical protein
MLGLDYSGGRPSGAAVHAAGYGFVVRYLDNGLSGRVNLTAGEVSDMHSAGVAVALVWERKILGQPDRATQGHPAGVADAQAALAQAQAVGLAGSPIYFAVDFDIPDYSPSATSPRAKLGPVGDYFDGIASVLDHGRIGIYGGYWAVSRALDAGLAAWAWQTVAWSGGHEDPRIHLYQRVGATYVAGVECDVNEARQTNFGQQGETMAIDWSDTVTPAGLPPNKVADLLGYADEFARKANDNSAAALAESKTTSSKVDALAAQHATDMAALATRLDALTAAIAAQHPGTTGDIHVEGTLTVTAPTG